MSQKYSPRCTCNTGTHDLQLWHKKVPSPRFFTLETYFLGINDPFPKLLLMNENFQKFVLSHFSHLRYRIRCNYSATTIETQHRNIIKHLAPRIFLNYFRRLIRMHVDILSATILECLNTTLSSVLLQHLCPWCSKDQPVPGLVWLRETILDPVGPRSGKA